jgi:predicted site-specific integrase-resolvase
MKNRTKITPLLKIDEVSQILHVHGNTVRRWTKKGILRPYIINSRGDHRYNSKDIRQFLANLINDKGDIG